MISSNLLCRRAYHMCCRLRCNIDRHQGWSVSFALLHIVQQIEVGRYRLQRSQSFPVQCPLNVNTKALAVSTKDSGSMCRKITLLFAITWELFQDDLEPYAVQTPILAAEATGSVHVIIHVSV